jgi:hypothetical protein
MTPYQILLNHIYSDDGIVEITASETGIIILYAGNHYSSYSELPFNVQQFIDRYLMEIPLAFSIVHQAGYRGIEVVDRILRCLFGGFDAQPDMDLHSSLINVEYPSHCERCEYSKSFCKRAISPLTNAETQVAISIRNGSTDKELAAVTGRAEKTIRNQRTAIEKKLQGKTGKFQNKASITSFIIQNGV